jgi:flagellar biosynthesis anti-sigma factor FlgM
MMIKITAPTTGTPPLAEKSESESKAATAPKDRVSVEEARRVEQLVQAVRSQAGATRSARLSQIEAAIRGGGYKPDPGVIADRLLQAAEIDARIAAMMRS